MDEEIFYYYKTILEVCIINFIGDLYNFEFLNINFLIIHHCVISFTNVHVYVHICVNMLVTIYIKIKY